LKKLGVGTRAGQDWLEIDGLRSRAQSPERKRRVRRQEAPTIQTYEDHRMAMSFAIAGLRVPLRIEQPEVVSKSFPGFWEYWKMGLKRVHRRNEIRKSNGVRLQRSARSKSMPQAP
jgi:5-enolpyruvylshikimate-3-phosphate synthase